MADERSLDQHGKNMFEIYDNNGVLLGRIEEKFYHGQRFRIAGDRFFLVDRDVEMAVFEYKIVNTN